MDLIMSGGEIPKIFIADGLIDFHPNIQLRLIQNCISHTHNYDALGYPIPIPKGTIVTCESIKTINYKTYIIAKYENRIYDIYSIYFELLPLEKPEIVLIL